MGIRTQRHRSRGATSTLGTPWRVTDCLAGRHHNKET